jgi:hypothetical protein
MVGSQFYDRYRLRASPQERRSHVPEIGFCEEKQRLTNRLLEAIHELTSLHSQQAQAVIDSDQDFPRFDMLLHLAPEKKDNAKYMRVSRA